VRGAPDLSKEGTRTAHCKYGPKLSTRLPRAIVKSIMMLGVVATCSGHEAALGGNDSANALDANYGHDIGEWLACGMWGQFQRA
jgi:hypothetical protein